MNTDRQQLTDYLHILLNNQAREDEVRENGHSGRLRRDINTTTAELFAMMVTASALMDINETLKEILDEL